MKRELPSIDLFYVEEKEMIISVIVKSGYIRIVGSLLIDEENRYRPWIKGRYKDFRYLSHKDELGIHCYYVLLKKTNGKGVLIELVNRETIMDDVDYDTFHQCLPKVMDYCKHIVVPIISIWNKKEKTYALYTPSKGMIYGPYHYQEIEEYKYGVILDKRYAVCNHAYYCDLSKFLNLGGVYYQKENNSYIIFVDEDMALYRSMYEDEKDESILYLKTKKYVYKYNKEKGELIKDKIQKHTGSGVLYV